MSIEAQFNRIAAEYDGKRACFIPCFDEYYGGATAFLAENWRRPKRLLDLGAGTGLLTAFWYRVFPQAEYLLVDLAEEMLRVARQRFAGLPNVSYQLGDYARQLPEGDFDGVISALSIHHLEQAEKRALFARIYDRLPAGGLFANYDQFCAGSPTLDRWLNSTWKRQLETSGLTKQDLLQWRERRTLDRECSVEEEIAMLRACGFREVACVYANQKFAVIAAIK